MPDDRAAILFLPLPDTLDELFTPKVVPLYTVSRKCFFDGVLSSYARMVRAWNPARFESLHTFPPDEDVLDCVVEDVAHRQNPRDIWRGNYNGVGHAVPVHSRVEEIMRLPILVPLVLDIPRVICFRKFLHHNFEIDE